MAEADDVHHQLSRRIELGVRTGALILLVLGSLLILAPFAGMVLWAVIICVASDDAVSWVVDRFGWRRGRAAALLVVAAFAALIVPAILLSETLIGGAHGFAEQLKEGSIGVPPPPAKVADWPLVGEPIHAAWKLASENLEAALGQLRPQLEALSRWLLSAAGAAGIGLLQLAAALILAGIFLAGSDGYGAKSVELATRLAGDRGPEFAHLAASTVKSVVRGIVGVAIIQTTLAGVAYMLAGVPAAGVWALFVLVAAVVQLPVLLVMIPPILLVYASSGTLLTVIFAGWCVVVALLDNVLKPIFFGRGVAVPTVVVFLGAIGGMLTLGIVGLFVGPVVLSLTYELFVTWMSEGDGSSSA